MAGKGNSTTKKFERGVKSKNVLQKEGKIDETVAAETAKDLESHPIEVEQIRFLQRQGAQSGVDVKAEKLKKQQEERDEYNKSLKLPDNSEYSKVIIPKGHCVIKLFKKPIFELNGFLKPDLIKIKSESGAGISYAENKFPYLDAGVIVNMSEIEKLFTISENESLLGAVVTLKIGVKLDKYVYFIDKTDINPTHFDGYLVLPSYELESILCLQNSEYYDSIVNKCLGKIGNVELQSKINKEKEVKENE